MGTRPPFLLDGGRAGDGGVHAETGTSAVWRRRPIAPSPQPSGYTTTQPSSIEEEGFHGSQPQPQIVDTTAWPGASSPRRGRPAHGPVHRQPAPGRPLQEFQVPPPLG